MVTFRLNVERKWINKLVFLQVFLLLHVLFFFCHSREKNNDITETKYPSHLSVPANLLNLLLLKMAGFKLDITERIYKQTFVKCQNVTGNCVCSKDLCADHPGAAESDQKVA